jgi:(Z)-2-((N-methylformamido)methylene)-5-hydroxybutyrolactone dehydrogenase
MLSRLSLERFDMVIDGERRQARDEAVYESVDPTLGKPWAALPEASAEDVNDAVVAAQASFESTWSSLSPTARGRHMLKLAETLAGAADELAQIETRENGKLLKEMSAQARVVPEHFYYWGGMADKVEGRVIPLHGQNALNYAVREPLGVVGVITPWNSPLMLGVQSMAPALAAGNTIVIKPSEVASAGVLKMMDFVEQAGLPPGTINVITGAGSAGAALAAHPLVRGMVFTGGTATGRAVAVAAAAHGATCVLELGGKSPNIVFADADLDQAEAGVLAGIYGAAGQTCVAGSRVLVDAAIYDEFVARLRARTDSILVGDPRSADTQMGPIASAGQLAKVEDFVSVAAQEGGEILSGGQRANVEQAPDGFFYRPTIVENVEPEHRLAREEVFGPVMAVLRFSSEEEAVRLANATEFGLAAGVWTTNLKRAHRVARALVAGVVWVNTYRAVAFNSPFGGHRASGTGRVTDIEAIYQFLQTKSVWCDLGDEVRDPFVIKV